MKCVISYSLYGHEPRYVLGALRNAIGVRQYYPAWTPRFYIDCATFERNAWVCCQLECAGAEVIVMGRDNSIPPMLWRFLVADDLEVDRFLIRDCDSRLSHREADAVGEWIKSDLILHVMRDHPAHQVIPGGMWGAMWRRPNWEAPKMARLIERFLEHHKGDPSAYQADQDFLARYVWPWASASALIHDSSPDRRNEIGGQRFPRKREWPRFVGEVMLIGENGEDIPRPGDWGQIQRDDQ